MNNKFTTSFFPNNESVEHFSWPKSAHREGRMMNIPVVYFFGGAAMCKRVVTYKQRQTTRRRKKNISPDGIVFSRPCIASEVWTAFENVITKLRSDLMLSGTTWKLS
jgi:hypothetical protein